MDERALYPLLMEQEEQDEQQQVETADNTEGRRHPYMLSEPIGYGERQEHHDGNDEQEEKDSQRGRRQQAHHLVYHVQLHVFSLKSEIMFEQLC